MNGFVSHGGISINKQKEWNRKCPHCRLIFVLYSCTCRSFICIDDRWCSWSRRLWSYTLDIIFKIVRHFTHRASVTSIRIEATSHSADWLMLSVYCEWNNPDPCSHLTRPVCAAVLKNYDRDFREGKTLELIFIWTSSKENIYKRAHEKLVFIRTCRRKMVWTH